MSTKTHIDYTSENSICILENFPCGSQNVCIYLSTFFRSAPSLTVAGKLSQKDSKLSQKGAAAWQGAAVPQMLSHQKKGFRWHRIQSSASSMRKNWEKCKLLTRHFSLHSSTKYKQYGCQWRQKKGRWAEKRGVKECGVWHKGLSPIGACKPISSRQNCYYGKRLHNAIYIFHTRKSNWILWP